MNSTHLRSPLSTVRGLGSAKEGVHHWWLHRVTAIALVPLSLWFMVTLLTHFTSATRVDVADWFANPFAALFMLAFILTLIVHCKLGVQAVIEDYVHKECCKITFLLLTTFASWILALVTLFAIAKLHFIGI